MIDTHAHLDDEGFAADLPQVLERAVAAGVEAIICPGIGAESSEAVVRLAESHAILHAAAGIQPNYGKEAAEGDWDRIVALVENGAAVAIGETGLDRYWDFTPFEVQRDYFDRHLQFAQKRDLPVIIHCREAEAETLKMLREAIARGPLRGVIHAFSGNEDFAAACLDLGMYISLAGPATYTNKKFESLRLAAKIVPDDRLLIETDSPYLVPHPLRGKQNRNEPALIRYTAKGLAELRGMPVEDLIALTTANARALFRIC
jgi:TatD DNase family protein